MGSITGVFRAVSSDEERGQVLLVDDNQDLLESLSQILTCSGFEVVSASNGKEALEVLNNNEVPDVIVSDIMMKELDGYELHVQVRSHTEWGQVPFVFLSALNEPEDVRKGKSLGCDDYLQKPFHPDDLIAVLDGKIAQSRRRKTLSEERVTCYRRNIIKTLSHEFRTPLVAVSTGAELLMAKLLETNDKALISLCRSVLRGGNRLSSLVEDFMTLQQIESGMAQKTCELDREEAELWNLLRRSVQYIRSNSLKSDEKLELLDIAEPGLEGSKVNICSTQISDVLNRVIGNALKFGGSSGPVKTWLASSEEGFVSIFVRDYGPGLSESEMSAARELFVQVDREVKEQQGCGLGLTITSYYVELNGGTAHFRTPEDGEGGLEVELVFPNCTYP